MPWSEPWLWCCSWDLGRCTASGGWRLWLGPGWCSCRAGRPPSPSRRSGEPVHSPCQLHWRFAPDPEMPQLLCTEALWRKWKLKEREHYFSPFTERIVNKFQMILILVAWTCAMFIKGVDTRRAVPPHIWGTSCTFLQICLKHFLYSLKYILFSLNFQKNPTLQHLRPSCSSNCTETNLENTNHKRDMGKRREFPQIFGCK